MALWAFILSLTPLVSLAFSALAEAAYADQGGAGPSMAPLFLLGGLGSLLSIGGPIAAIAMGLAARRDPTIDQSSRNLALAAVLIGAITLGLYVVAILLVILFIAACAAACGSASTVAGTAAAAAPCASLGTEHRRRPGHAVPWRDAFAHHPDIPALGADVFRVAGARLCVGCFTAGPALAAAFLVGWLLPLPAAAAAVVGLPLALMQGLSAAGWTTTRWRKVAVKTCFGTGAGLVLHAIFAAPWPEEARSLALAACGLLALASTRPRLRRIARLAAETAPGA